MLQDTKITDPRKTTKTHNYRTYCIDEQGNRVEKNDPSTKGCKSVGIEAKTNPEKSK